MKRSLIVITLSLITNATYAIDKNDVYFYGLYKEPVDAIFAQIGSSGSIRDLSCNLIDPSTCRGSLITVNANRKKAQKSEVI